MGPAISTELQRETPSSHSRSVKIETRKSIDECIMRIYHGY